MAPSAPPVSVAFVSRDEGDTLSTTVGAIAATVPVGAEVVAGDEEGCPGYGDPDAP